LLRDSSLIVLKIFAKIDNKVRKYKENKVNLEKIIFESLNLKDSSFKRSIRIHEHLQEM
jgi:hypothetical protein